MSSNNIDPDSNIDINTVWVYFIVTKITAWQSKEIKVFLVAHKHKAVEKTYSENFFKLGLLSKIVLYKV